MHAFFPSTTVAENNYTEKKSGDILDFPVMLLLLADKLFDFYLQEYMWKKQHQGIIFGNRTYILYITGFLLNYSTFKVNTAIYLA